MIFGTAPELRISVAFPCFLRNGLCNRRDNQFNEQALQTAFVGTELPLELSRKRIEVIVLTGIPSIGASRGMHEPRVIGYLLIVIGNATATRKPEQQAASCERITIFFRAGDLVRHIRRAAESACLIRRAASADV